MRAAIVISIWSIFLSSVSIAGVFGPANYNECILEYMKGATSDEAATQIMYACRNKFPSEHSCKNEQELTQDSLKAMLIKVLFEKGKGVGRIYNGDKRFTLVWVVVRLTNEDTKQFLDYSIPVVDVTPLSTSDVTFDVIAMPKNYSATIVKALGCEEKLWK